MAWKVLFLHRVLGVNRKMRTTDGRAFAQQTEAALERINDAKLLAKKRFDLADEQTRKLLESRAAH